MAIDELSERLREEPRYKVWTWDADGQAFTPQVGVRCGPHTIWGLKRALRKLQSMGYPCNRSHPWGLRGDTESDPSVLVERVS